MAHFASRCRQNDCPEIGFSISAHIFNFVTSRLLRKLEEVVSGTGELVYSLVFGRQQRRFIRHLVSNSPRPQRRVIVSLTTLPDRIGNLEPTLRSLVQQTRPPDEVVVSLPRLSIRQEKPYLVPSFLEQMPGVRLLHCETDWGPATKFIPVIQEELAAGRGDTLIMVVDDDRTYPPDALETYLYFHRAIPDAVLCFRGALMPHSLVWFFPKMIRGNQIRTPEPVAVITGTASYLIQPRFFDSTLWDYTGAPASAFYTDDIWISGCLDRRGIKKYVVPTSRMMRAVPAQWRTIALSDVPNGPIRSNTEVIDFFHDRWNVFYSRPVMSLRLFSTWIRSFRQSPGRFKPGSMFSAPEAERPAAEIEK